MATMSPRSPIGESLTDYLIRAEEVILPRHLSEIARPDPIAPGRRGLEKRS